MDESGKKSKGDIAADYEIAVKIAMDSVTRQDKMEKLVADAKRILFLYEPSFFVGADALSVLKDAVTNAIVKDAVCTKETVDSLLTA